MDLVGLGINDKNLWGLGENICFYGMEWVSNEAYEKIISIMEKAKKEVKDCLEDTKGEKNIPMLVLGAVDKYKIEN